MSKKTNNFYAVSGANAVLVADDYGRALRCLGKYFKRPKCIVGYTTLAEAHAAAMEHFRAITPAGRSLPDALELNKVYASSKLPLTLESK